MTTARATGSARIRARPEDVYALIADYRDGHPRILPPLYFPRLEVEKGGVGEGTVIRFQVRILGKTREIQATVTEPTPGRVLVETDMVTGSRTTFTVTPEDGGEACRVEIRTEWEARGLRGWMERVMAPRVLKRMYAAELYLLATIAEGTG